MRVEHEYRRHGVCAYIAAWDMHRARLFGEVVKKISIVAFDALVAQVMTQERYRSARRVFWIVDGSTIHRGQRAAANTPGLAQGQMSQGEFPLYGFDEFVSRHLLAHGDGEITVRAAPFAEWDVDIQVHGGRYEVGGKWEVGSRRWEVGGRG